MVYTVESIKLNMFCVYFSKAVEVSAFYRRLVVKSEIKICPCSDTI